MERILTGITLLACGLSAAAAPAQEGPSRQHFIAGVDLSYVSTSGLPSWTEGFVGKLRHDDESDGLMVSQAFFDYSVLVTDTIDFNATAFFYDDDLGSAVDFTEAYAEWRPVPRSANRYRLKVGAFYPRLSLENTGPAWSSPYTLSSSTVNTWIAEEVRVFGAELSWSRRPEWLGGSQKVGLHAAIFRGNDPAGSLLAWKGWSAHDRQSRFGDELPLPPLPQIQPGMMFEAQDPFVAPFREIDDKEGFYVGGDWQIGNRFLLTAMYYDNRADPTILEDGQYAWTTKFNHFGAQIELPFEIGLMGQMIRGSTVMGPVMNGAHAVDVEFDSRYAMITRQLDKHRVSLRYDNFKVLQNDRVPEDNNPEHGLVWTASYRYNHSDMVSFAAEWLSIKSHHCGWVYYGLDPTATEKQFQFSLLLRFSR